MSFHKVLRSGLYIRSDADPEARTSVKIGTIVELSDLAAIQLTAAEYVESSAASPATEKLQPEKKPKPAEAEKGDKS